MAERSAYWRVIHNGQLFDVTGIKVDSVYLIPYVSSV